MKGTDIKRLAKTGQSFAIVNPRVYVGKVYRNLTYISRNQVVEARIQSVDVQYRKQYSRGQTDPNMWQRAETSERAKGFMVRYTDEQGNDLYYAAASTEFIDTWTAVNGAITAREQEKAEREREANAAREAKLAEEQRRAAIRAGAAARSRDMLTRGQEQMRVITTSILGETHSLYIGARLEEEFTDDGAYNAYVTGQITLSYGDYARLLEKYLEALDAAR
jgi:hypothetical protein